MDVPKPRNWTPLICILVAIGVYVLTIVVWPRLKQTNEKPLAAEAKKDVRDANPASTTPKDTPEATQPKQLEGQPPLVSTPPVNLPKDTTSPVDPRPTAVRFRDITIEEPFKAAFAKSKTLMDTPQILEFMLPDGQAAVVCVVNASMEMDNRFNRLDAEKECSTKMVAALQAWKRGLSTGRTDELDPKTERVEASIVTAMRSKVVMLPPVGKWIGIKGYDYYMAFGKVFASNELKP